MADSTQGNQSNDEYLEKDEDEGQGSCTLSKEKSAGQAEFSLLYTATISLSVRSQCR